MKKILVLIAIICSFTLVACAKKEQEPIIEEKIVEYINKEIEDDGQVLFSYKIDKMKNYGEVDGNCYIMKTITYNWSNEPVVSTLLVLCDKDGKIEYKVVGE